MTPASEQAPHKVTKIVSSFEAVFREEAPYVLRLLGRFGVPLREREDVAQEVFVRVHQKFADYDAGMPIRPWLYAFAYRCASNHRRLHRNERESPRAELPERHDSHTPEEAQINKQRRALLMSLLDELDWKQRSVLVLHDLEQMDVKTIADTLETPTTRDSGVAANKRRAAQTPRQSPSSLVQERRILNVAQGALNRGRLTQVRSALQEHEKKFPDGLLREERDALRIRLLRRDGQDLDAEERLDAFEARYPKSIFLNDWLWWVVSRHNTTAQATRAIATELAPT